MDGVWSLIKIARQALHDGDFTTVKECLDKINSGFHQDKMARLDKHHSKKRRREIYAPSKGYKDE